MRGCPLWCWLLLPVVVLFNGHGQAGTTEILFERLQDRVYQLRVIDRASDARSSSGSGFLVADSGVIATNYHVISRMVRDPDKYRLEYLDADNETGGLEVVAVDVRNDLALVRGEVSADEPLPLRGDRPLRGAPVYSLGNPLDLGMSIVEGSYNGVDESSMYRWLLFSGPLNRGMSGGPAIDSEGRVLGVNKARTGQSIGFFVPVDRLEKMLERLAARGYEPPDSFDAVIEDQLKDHQSRFMDEVLAGDWPTYELGPARVPDQLAAFLNCSGGSSSNDRELYSRSQRGCGTRYSISLASGHDTGTIHLQASVYSSDGMSPQRFYNLYERGYGPGRFLDGEEDEVTEFTCQSRLIQSGATFWKAAFCARAYRRYEDLYDTYVALASVGAVDQGVIVKASLRGVMRDNAERFAEQLIETLQWNP